MIGPQPVASMVNASDPRPDQFTAGIAANLVAVVFFLAFAAMSARLTVFLTDVRHAMPMTEIRQEVFGRDFPASAALTVTRFAQSEIVIEIQGIAVVKRK